MHIRLHFITGFFLLFPFCMGNTTYQDIRSKADSLLNAYCFDSAAVHYIRIANEDPELGDYHNNALFLRKAGQLYLYIARYQAAENTLLKADSIQRRYFSVSDSSELSERLNLLNTLIELRTRQGNYPAADALCLEASAYYRQEEIPFDQARAGFYEQSGYLNIHKGNFSEASQFLDSASCLNSRLYDEYSSQWIDLYFALGLLSRTKGELDEALGYYQKVDNVLKHQPKTNLSQMAKLYHYMAVVLENKSELERAAKYFEKSLEIHLSIYGDDHPLLGSLYNNMAIVYGKSGRYDIAQELNFKSLNITLKYFGKEFYDVARTYNNIGFVYVKMGRYDEAIEYYDRALRIKKKIFGENHEDISSTSNNIAEVYIEKGDYEKASYYVEYALQINLLVFGEQSAEVADNFEVISKINLHKGSYDEALDYIDRALAIRKKSYGILFPDVAKCFARRSEILVRQGDLSLAVKNLDSSIYIYKKCYHEKHPALTEAYISLSNYYSLLEKYDNALASIQMALIANSYSFTDTSVSNNPADSSIIQPSLFLRAMTCKADLFYKLYCAKGSTVYLENSLIVYESINEFVNWIRNTYRFEASRLYLSRMTKELYEKAIEAAYKYFMIYPARENANRIFTFIENAKSATLTLQANENDALLFSDVPDSLELIMQQLTAELSICNTEIEKLRSEDITTDYPELISLQNKKFDLTRRYDSLISSLEINYPLYKKIKYAFTRVDPEEICKLLGPGEIAIDYYINDTVLFIAMIDNNELIINRKWIGNSFKKQISDYYSNMRKANPENFAELSYSLYGILIKPVEPYLNNKKKIIIIPDDYLYYLPFETLISEKNQINNLDFSKADFLIKKYDLVYHQSLTLWHNTKSRMETNLVPVRRNLVAFAPVFGNVGDELVIFSDEQQNTFNDKISRSGSRDHDNLNYLPYSKEEVTSLVETFRQQNLEAIGFLYSAASETNFLRYAGDYDFVHISSHGISDTAQPDLSGIAFSKPEVINQGNLPIDDGILYLGELHKVHLNASLVVISSCESGMGKLMAGEGIKSMTRGFLYLNTPNVVYSMWKVLDKSTKDLMISFYRSVLDTNSYSGALRDAKIMMIQNPGTSFPFFWGGFLLTGN